MAGSGLGSLGGGWGGGRRGRSLSLRVLRKVGGSSGSCLRVRRKVVGILGVGRKVGGSPGSSVGHRALEVGGFTWREQMDNRAF